MDLLIELSENYLNKLSKKGILYLWGSYYSGIQIITDLKRLGIGGCGTIQLNRLQLSEADKEKLTKLKDREILYLQTQDKLLLSCWKDSKLVLVLSNYHHVQNTTLERTIRKKDWKKKITLLT